MALNTRIYPRHQVRIEVRYRITGGASSAATFDISRGRLFLETSQKFTTGQALTLEISLPGKGLVLDIPARVIHSHTGTRKGAGIEFGPLPARDRRLLDDYIAQLAEAVEGTKTY